MLKGNLLFGFLCIALTIAAFFFIWMKVTSNENLEWIFSAVALAAAVVFLVMIGSVLLSAYFSYLFELDGYPII